MLINTHTVVDENITEFNHHSVDNENTYRMNENIYNNNNFDSNKNNRSDHGNNISNNSKDDNNFAENKVMLYK